MKKLLLFLTIILASAIVSAFVPKSFGNGGSVGRDSGTQCSSLSQNYSVYFSSIRLNYDFSQQNPDVGSYANWEYQEDRDELMQAHPFNHSSGYSGYFDDFPSIMDCYADYSYGEKLSRKPSITVKYTGKCRGDVTINYLPVGNDASHCYSVTSLIGAPLFSPNDVTQGAMTIKSIKSKKHGIQLKWQYTIESNDVSNVDAIAATKTALVSGLSLYAVVSSDVPPVQTGDDNNRYNDRGKIAIYVDSKYLPVKSSSNSYRIVENTVPKDLIGKAVRILPTDDIVCSPHLDGQIYICGEYSSSVKWNKPSIYDIQEQ